MEGGVPVVAEQPILLVPGIRNAMFLAEECPIGVPPSAQHLLHALVDEQILAPIATPTAYLVEVGQAKIDAGDPI